MTWSRHGHHIPASPTDDEEGNRPPVARCGGHHLCKSCKEDFEAYLNRDKVAEGEAPESLQVVSYRRKDSNVSAIQLSDGNIEQLAKMTGGDIGHGYLQLPSTRAMFEEVYVGDYVIKDNDTGKWSGMNRDEFEDLYLVKKSTETSVEYEQINKARVTSVGLVPEEETPKDAEGNPVTWIKQGYPDIEDTIRDSIIRPQPRRL